MFLEETGTGDLSALAGMAHGAVLHFPAIRPHSVQITGELPIESGGVGAEGLIEISVFHIRSPPFPDFDLP
jgi:hypothetical protein